MAHYQYNGLHFELPDGMSNEQALSKIKAHLGETEAKKQEPSIGDKLIAGTKQMAASAVNTMDTGVSLAASLPARLFQGQEAQEEIFKNLNTRTASRNWGEGVDPGVMGKVAGAVVTLPAQMLAMGLSPAQTGKTALDLGESLPTALKAAGVDAAGNAVGLLLPGAVGVSRAAKVGSGVGINAAQEALTKVGIQGLMETQQGKKAFAPTLEDTLVSGIVGAGVGSLHKAKAPQTSSGQKDIKGAVAKEAAVTAPVAAYKQPIQPDPSSQRWERAVADLGGEILPKETPFSGMVDTLSGNPRVIEPEFKMAPEEAPYKKTGAEAAADDATVARLQAAVDRQNPQLPEMIATKDGIVDSSTNTPGLRAAIGLDELPNRTQAVFEDQVQQIKRAQEEAAWNQHSQEQLAQDTQQRAREEAQMAQEGALQPLEEQLRREAYQPPTQEDLRAGHLSGRSPRIGKFGQGGSAPMFNDLAEGIVSLGKGIKAKFTGEKTAVPDSVINPTSTDNIAKKQRMADRHEALGIKDSVYRNVSTVEEATTNPGKDIGKHQELASGTEGVIRRNKTNKPINFIRTMEVKARWAADALIRQHITGTDGLNRVIAKLSKVEQLEIAELITELSNRKVDYSSRIAEELSLSPAQRAFMERRASSFQAVKSLMDEYNAKNGFELVESLNGYAPSLFSSQYASPVYKVVKDSAGKEHRTVVGVANGRSLAEWELAKKYFDEKGFTVEPYKRRGLKTKAGYDREFDGTLQMLREMAEQDPRFAELQQGLEVVQRESAKKLYGLNVHEMHKKGVEGAVGQKPWRSAEQNAKERLEAEINYLDQAFKYWSYQDFITQSKTLVDNPALADMKNTREYINDHVKQVTGVDLNPIGTFSNSIVDLAFKYVVPKSMPENPQRVASAVRDTFSAIAMNIYAPLYATVNLLQPFTGGLPEALRIRAAAGLNPQDVLTSLSNAAVMRTVISSLDLFNIDPTKTKIPAHLIEAQRFMKKHAMESFNEAQMSHEGAQNPKLQRVKQGAFWPTIIPEMATRPTVFMWYVDMFHKAGLKGEDLMMTAYNASEHAMVGYHPDQRPMLYSQMGMYGTMTGQLKTFGHNAIENLISRTKEAKEYPAAYLAMMSMLVGLGGISGLPGFENLDEWVIQPLTGKSALRHMQSLPPELVHGAASAYSGLDWQSRFSMAGTIPTDLKDLMGASVSKMIDIGSAGVDFIKNNDTGSFNALMKATIPSGAYGAYEDQQLTTQDGFVLDKEGQIKYDQPRTERERKVRAVWGLRPLRERLEDADLYARDREWAKMTEKEKKQATLMKRALNFKDDEGFWNAYTKYKELGGDPTLVQNMIEQNAVQANMDARTRRSGVPSDSIKSIKKYQHYTEE